MDIDTLYIKPGVKSVVNWDTLVISEYDLEDNEFIQDIPIPDEMLPLKTGRAIAVAEGVVAEQLAQQTSDVTASLANAILVTQNSPYNTPEEQAIVDATVATALAEYRALNNPPTDITNLATELISWKI